MPISNQGMYPLLHTKVKLLSGPVMSTMYDRQPGVPLSCQLLCGPRIRYGVPKESRVIQPGALARLYRCISVGVVRRDMMERK